MLKHLFCVAVLISAFTLATHAVPPQAIPGRYIVQLKPSASPEKVAAAHGVTPDAVYTSAINGFAGAVPEARLEALKKHNDVISVEPDVIVRIEDNPHDASAEATQNVSANGELLPFGVARIEADLNPRTDVSAVGVAIIDTGISRSHPDLNVAGAVSYVRGNKNGEDDNGHGSHVAGIVGAKLNGNGIRGVAPNARLYAVKVLDRGGSGSLSDIISGVDWVTRNAGPKAIKVANMSLGMQGTSSSLNSAISSMVAAGVTTTVAAGNSGADATTFSPANHPSVICVSAIADSDGDPGHLGAGTSYGNDDTLASFSNYGSVVDIAAPGVNIYSTYMSGGYATLSGTSMASPHAAGAAALYVASHPGATPTDVRNGLLAAAWAQSAAEAFTGDRDNSPEPLLHAAGL